MAECVDVAVKQRRIVFERELHVIEPQMLHVEIVDGEVVETTLVHLYLSLGKCGAICLLNYGEIVEIILASVH